MPWSLVNTAATSNNGAGSTLGVAMAVQAGDLVVCTVSEGTNGSAITVSDGTNALTAIGVPASGATDELAGYWLTAPLTASPIYTATFTGTPTSRSIALMAFRYSGPFTVDGFSALLAAGVAVSSSGNISTTGGDDLCVGAQYNQNQAASSAEAINSVTALLVLNSGTNHTMWFTTPTARFTGASSSNIGSTTTVLGLVIAFRIAFAPGSTGSSPAYVKKRVPRQQRMDELP